MATYRKTTRLVATAVVCALGLAAAALATPSDTQYGNPLATETTPTIAAVTTGSTTTVPGTVPETTTVTETTATEPTVTETEGATEPAATQKAPAPASKALTTAPAKHQSPIVAAKGALPFTGLDLALVLIGGAGALAAGFGLRRVARRRSS